MRKLLFALLFFSASAPLSAAVVVSSVTVDGEASSSSDDDAANGILRDSTTGDIYTVGTLAKLTNGGALLTKDIFVAKYNSSFVLQASSIVAGPGSGDDEGFGIARDSSGNVYITGTISTTTTKLYLAKFNSSLVFQSSVTIAGAASGTNGGRGIAVSGSNLYVTGFVTSSSDEDLFVAKYNTSLVFQSSTTIDIAGLDDRGNAIALDSSDNVYVTGFISSATNTQDLFLAKFNSSLVFQSSTTLHEGTADSGNGIAINGSDIYITGVWGNSLGSDIILAKFNTSLVFQSSFTAAGISGGTDGGQGIDVDSSGNVYITGFVSESAGNGGTNIYYSKLDSSLALLSSTTITTASSNTDKGMDAAADGSGNAYIGGYVAVSATDFYLAKLAEDAAIPTISVSSKSATSLTWAWVDVSTETGYRVVYGTSPAITVSAALAANTTTFLETGLSTNTAYSRAVAAIGTESNSTSTAITAYTLAAIPSTPSVTSALISSVTIAWGPNGNPGIASTTYRIGYWLDNNSTTTIDTTAHDYTITGLGGGNTYFFQIQAINGDGLLTDATAAISTVTATQGPLSQLVTANSSSTIIFSPNTGEIILSIPAASYGQDVTFDLTTPASIPSMNSPGAQLRATGVAVDISPTPNIVASKNLTLSMSYRDMDVIGMDESRLICVRYTGALWVPVQDSTPDPKNNRVTCQVRAFSIYQIAEAAPQAGSTHAKIYPNPFIPSRGHTQVNFSDMPGNSRISVYTLVGEQVADFFSTLGGLASWDVRNFSGEPLASGLYLIHIQGHKDKIYKLGIER